MCLYDRVSQILLSSLFQVGEHRRSQLSRSQPALGYLCETRARDVAVTSTTKYRRMSLLFRGGVPLRFDRYECKPCASSRYVCTPIGSIESFSSRDATRQTRARARARVRFSVLRSLPYAEVRTRKSFRAMDSERRRKSTRAHIGSPNRTR